MQELLCDFLLFFAVNEGREVVLTGSQRMTDAIKVLVEALEQLETIIYEKKWAIRLFESRTKITASKVNIPANVSSQYISALLIAPKLEKEWK
jgi:3-phosphoshikimate 1-carboxyvinyltransferase